MTLSAGPVLGPQSAPIPTGNFWIPSTTVSLPSTVVPSPVGAVPFLDPSGAAVLNGGAAPLAPAGIPLPLPPTTVLGQGVLPVSLGYVGTNVSPNSQVPVLAAPLVYPPLDKLPLAPAPPRSAPLSSSSSQGSKPSSSAMVKKYICKFCLKRFSRPSSLTTHTYTHTGERPFPCTLPHCGRSFSVLSNLRRHVLVCQRNQKKRAQFLKYMEENGETVPVMGRTPVPFVMELHGETQARSETPLSEDVESQSGSRRHSVVSMEDEGSSSSPSLPRAETLVRPVPVLAVAQSDSSTSDEYPQPEASLGVPSSSLPIPLHHQPQQQSQPQQALSSSSEGQDWASSPTKAPRSFDEDDDFAHRRGSSSLTGSNGTDSRSSDSGGDENKSNPSSNHTGRSFDSGVAMSKTGRH